MNFQWVLPVFPAGDLFRRYAMTKKEQRINRLFLYAGILTLIYYLGQGITVRFGQSLLYLWLMLSAVCFGKILLVDRLLMGNSSITVAVALVVCLTMAITVLLAKTVGCILPITAKRLGFDPAVMASPFITTIVDALSLLVYFGIAKVLLGV